MKNWQRSRTNRSSCASAGSPAHSIPFHSSETSPKRPEHLISSAEVRSFSFLHQSHISLLLSLFSVAFSCHVYLSSYLWLLGRFYAVREFNRTQITYRRFHFNIKSRWREKEKREKEREKCLVIGCNDERFGTTTIQLIQSLCARTSAAIPATFLYHRVSVV